MESVIWIFRVIYFILGATLLYSLSDIIESDVSIIAKLIFAFMAYGCFSLAINGIKYSGDKVVKKTSRRNHQ